MQSRSEVKWTQMDPQKRAQTVAARKLLRASTKGEDISVVILDPELREEAGDEVISLVRSLCARAAALPQTLCPNREWFGRATMQLLEM